MIELLLALCVSPLIADDPLQCDVLVVCHQECDQPLTEWIRHRESQGHNIALMRPADSETLQTTIRQLATQGRLKYVLLIGDAPSREEANTRPLKPFEVPTCFVKAQVNVKFGSEEWIASDNHYADLDEDGNPDLAIGRLAVDQPQELTELLNRSLQYESKQQGSRWRRNINLVAGVGGFGVMADSLIEMSAKRLIVNGIPASYNTTMTYGSWQSPYCPNPLAFRQATVDRFNEGCLFWVYMGHGSPGHLAPLQTPLAYYPIFDRQCVPALDNRTGTPIAIFLACYTCAFDLNTPEDCLAEQMMRTPGGPVAVLGASRVSMPYAMAVLSDAMLEQYFTHEHVTIGDLVLQAKRASISAENESRNRAVLDALATSLSPTKDMLEAERIENAALFNLLGDPLLRLAYPLPIPLNTPDTMRSGDTVLIEGTSPAQGTMHVEIVYRRDRTIQNYDRRDEFDPRPNSLGDYDRTYREANNRQLAVAEIEVEPGPFKATLTIPDWAKGAAYVRASLDSPHAHAQGGIEVLIRRPVKSR